MLGEATGEDVGEVVGVGTGEGTRRLSSGRIIGPPVIGDGKGAGWTSSVVESALGACIALGDGAADVVGVVVDLVKRSNSWVAAV